MLLYSFQRKNTQNKSHFIRTAEKKGTKEQKEDGKDVSLYQSLVLQGGKHHQNTDMKKTVYVILLILAVCLAAYAAGSAIQPDQPTEYHHKNKQHTSYQQQEKSTAPSRASGMEIPAYLTDRDEEIVQHDGFTLSYNKKLLIPNWVAWVLTSGRTRGNLKRANNFQPDETIKQGPIAYDTDYRGSGYSRGHMCPAADCKFSRNSMNECFLLSNICPQTHALNGGDWRELEELSRRWAQRYDSIYIVCGPVIEKGVRYATIGRSHVTVPNRFFKVFLRWTGRDQAEAIGFLYDNDDSSQPMVRCAVSVDEVEELTGINFFSKLPKHVERRAEAEFDVSHWTGILSNNKHY